jgi:hypothetical protein
MMIYRVQQVDPSYHSGWSSDNLGHGTTDAEATCPTQDEAVALMHELETNCGFRDMRVVEIDADGSETAVEYGLEGAPEDEEG